ncbi:MAG: hypothetical protein OXG55_15150 [bacterium]|nr:hypothetical protein [bacterium]
MRGRDALPPFGKVVWDVACFPVVVYGFFRLVDLLIDRAANGW